MRRRSAGLSRGLRPDRPAFFRLAKPPVASCLAQRLTDWRWTPTCLATSDCLLPWRKSRAACSRLCSNASKTSASRLTPRGFPMHPLYHKTAQMSLLYEELSSCFPAHWVAPWPLPLPNALELCRAAGRPTSILLRGASLASRGSPCGGSRVGTSEWSVGKCYFAVMALFARNPGGVPFLSDELHRL
jgi:hypothetical protein